MMHELTEKIIKFVPVYQQEQMDSIIREWLEENVNSPKSKRERLAEKIAEEFNNGHSSPLKVADIALDFLAKEHTHVWKPCEDSENMKICDCGTFLYKKQ